MGRQLADSPAGARRSRQRHLWVVVAVLLAVGGTIGAVAGAMTVARSDADESRRAFATSSAEITSALSLAIQHEEDLVVSAGGFVTGNPGTTNTEFVQWANSVHALQRYPELLGFGYSRIVQASQLPAFAGRAVKDPGGLLDADGRFRVIPPGQRPFYCLSAGGQARSPQAAFPAGFDFCTGTVGAVSLTARDTGHSAYFPIQNGKFTFLSILTPIYRSGTPVRTVPERRAAFLGWVGMELVSDLVLQHGLAGHPNTAVVLRYHANSSDATFRSGTLPGDATSVTTDLHNGWTVQTFGRAVHGDVLKDAGALGLLLAGSALSLSLGALVLVLATSRGRALALIDRQTEDLREQARQIEQSERKFRSLIQNSSDLTLVCDSDGTLSYVSPTSDRVIGTTATQLVGTALSKQLSSDDWATLARWLREPDPDMLVLTCCIGARDGRPRWVEATATDLRDDPAVGGVVLNIRDITDRQRLELELRHAQKLETIGQLSAGIAHEINTPIQYIGDNVRFLQDAVSELTQLLDRDATTSSTDSLTGEMRAAFTDTLTGVDRVATIVRAMKVFGHPGEELATGADLNETVRTTLTVANSQIRQVADVVTDLGDLPPVSCHVGDVNQVLLNLLINATQAIASVPRSGSPGTITVRTRADGDDVIIEVADTGCGIPPQARDRIFDPFFTTKPIGVGTGQGLAIAYSLIHDRHHGSITFTSEVGVGTTFTIRLPVGAPAATTIREPEGATRRPDRLTIGAR